MFKFVRNVVVRSVVISAILAGVSYGSYWLCKGLAWATTQLTTILTQCGEFVKGNVPAMVLLIVLVTVANIIFEATSGKIGGGQKRPLKRRNSKETQE